MEGKLIKPKKTKVNPYDKPKKVKPKAISKLRREPETIKSPKRELINPFDRPIGPKGPRKPKMMKGGKIAMSYNKGGLIQQD